jgi:hypothetical protein
VAVIIQIRRDTAANWASANPVLAQGEIGENLDNELIKIGDGVNNWLDLDYYGVTASGIVPHSSLTGLDNDDHPQYHDDSRGDARYYTQPQIDDIITTISGQLDDHNELNNLDYASSGHTGFQPAGDYATNTSLSTTSGSLQTQIDGKAPTVHSHVEADITDLDKYTQAEVDALITTISGQLDDHNELNNLDYASSGHTGFQAAGDYATNSKLSTVSGVLQSQITENANDIVSVSGSIITDHSALSNLDYASSGHTGFQPTGDYATNTALSTTSGTLQTQINNKSDVGHGHTESDISDLDKYTQAEVDALITTISGQLDDHSELNGLGNDDHLQYLRTDGTRQLSGDWNYGNANISGTGSFYGNGATLSGVAYVDGDDVYFYDTTRDKDLGVAIIEVGCGRNSANTTNQYLRTFNGTPMNQAGIALPVDATLIGMSASGGANTQTWTAQVGKNDVATVLDSITVTNAYENHSWDNDVDFSAGDRIQVYLNGTNINYPQVRLYFRRTK